MSNGCLGSSQNGNSVENQSRREKGRGHRSSLFLRSGPVPSSHRVGDRIVPMDELKVATAESQPAVSGGCAVTSPGWPESGIRRQPGRTRQRICCAQRQYWIVLLRKG